MFERFTSQARSAVVLAQAEGRELRHDRIGTQHVLLGILGEPDAAGARVLRELGLEPSGVRDEVARRFVLGSAFGEQDEEALRSVGIELDEVRRSVDEAFGPGALERRPTRRRGRRCEAGGAGHVPFTPGSKRALELSLREALRLGHSYIGTEHLVLGLVRDERSSAATILRGRGISPGDVREAVMREIARGGDRPGRTA
ncbi:MAG: Clp protease N-terminal domain-containing protein [Actinomycetota bacterium]